MCFGYFMVKSRMTKDSTGNGTDFSQESISLPRSAPDTQVLPTTRPGNTPADSRDAAFSLRVQCSRQVLEMTKLESAQEGVTREKVY